MKQLAANLARMLSGSRRAFAQDRLSLPSAAAPSSGNEVPSAAVRRHLASPLFRKTATLLVALIAGVLTVNAAIQSYYAFSESRTATIALQRETVRGAAAAIEQFIKEIESQLGWTTHAGVVSGDGGLEQHRLDFLRLLRQAPAITDVVWLDTEGRERIKVSRIAMDLTGSGADVSAEAKFTEAQAHGRYVSPVYFRQESEPYLTLAIAGRGRFTGVIAAEVNLKFVWDVVSKVRVGKGGTAYVVDAQGLLIAHPDMGLVLRKSDLSDLAHIAAALSATAGSTGIVEIPALSRDRLGREVMAAAASIEALQWVVVTEVPLAEAMAPVYDALLRAGMLLLAGLALAVLGGLWLARRIVVPIEALADGAARIGGGDLDHRIDVKTGDEVEQLARGFNTMASRLKDSYVGLERKVEKRTAELQTAMVELELRGRQLEHASRHKSEFLANMSHELRTPLNAILGYSELIRDGVYGEPLPRIKTVLDRVETNGRHLLGLINDVLDLAKIEAGQLVLEVGDYSLVNVVETVVAATEPLAAEKKLPLMIEMAQGLPTGHGDERRIHQVLLNLVGNAIKFTDNGQIWIAVTAEGSIFSLIVADTGPGIPVDEQTRIFEEFHQVNSSSNKAKGGTGLGLAISKRIVEMHGGRIWVDSMQGQGSSFHVELPIRVPESSGSSAP